MGISYDAAVHAVEIAAISLTTFNGLAAGLVVILALVDNYRHQKCWLKISIETRAPLYLAVCILFSHIVFAVRESRQLGSGIPIPEDAGTSSQLCITMTQTSWWAIWLPIVALTSRVFLMAMAILFRCNPFSIMSEVLYVILVATASASLWIPSHFLNPAPCSVFVMLFSPDSNSTLGLVGMITTAGLLLIICLSLIVIAWDICRTTPTNRRSLFLELDVLAMDPVIRSSAEQVFAKKSLVCYALGIFCQYACFLPHFTMLFLSRFSAPAVYVASISIHTSGIVLLFQYLFMRHTCTQCHRSISPDGRATDVPDTERGGGMLHRTLSDYSAASDDIKRARRRPYTTYGGGGEYSDFLRRQSSSSWNSSLARKGERVDRTASGRKIPVRTPSMEIRPRSAERPSESELRRSKSFGGEKRSSLFDSGNSAVPQLTTDAEGLREKVPSLRRTASSRFREHLEPARSETSRRSFETGDEIVPSPTRSRSGSSRDGFPGETATAGGTYQTFPRPILLPPLNDPTRPRSSSARRSDAEGPSSRPTSSRNSTETSALDPPHSVPGPFLRTLPIQTDINPAASTSTTSNSSEFAFPFGATPRPRSVEYEEDYSNWRPPSTNLTTDMSSQLAEVHSWPLSLEDLIEPEPPFATGDRHFVCTTPSESRLSTITEEGTVRDSVVATPPNIIHFDPAARAKENSSSSGRSEESAPVAQTMANWTGHEDHEDDVERTMRRLSDSPSRDSPTPTNENIHTL